MTTTHDAAREFLAQTGDLPLEGLRSEHIRTRYDKPFKDHMDDLIREIARTPGGGRNVDDPAVTEGAFEALNLFLIGGSRTGKSHLANRIPRLYPFLAPADGKRPLVYVTLRNSWTLKSIGEQLLRILAPHERMREKSGPQFWGRIAELLKALDTRVIVFDEASNVATGLTRDDIVRVVDALRSFNQIEGHTVCLVIAGTRTAAALLNGWHDTDEQFGNRSRVLELEPWTQTDADRVGTLVLKAADDQDMSLNFDPHEEEIGGRLVHACKGAFGGIVETVDRVVEDAARRQRRQGADPLLTMEDFAAFWRKRRPVPDRNNPFVSDDWKNISMVQLDKGDLV